MKDNEEYKEREKDGLRAFVKGREPKGHPL